MYRRGPGHCRGAGSGLIPVDTIGGLLVGRFVARPNRFVVIVESESGEQAVAHLPNTGRLTHLTTPGRRFLLRPEPDPARKTRFTAVRAWDGCWVALEAAKATSLLEDWLSAGNSLLPGIGAVDDLQTEVTLGRHRIDIRGQGSDGREVWIEVKSGGRADGDVALLSETPSTRAAAHLALLGELVAEGKQAAVVFVVQRSDVRTLRIGGDADPGWIEAVTEARSAGVVVLAYGCNVTPTHIAIARDLPVVWS